MYEEDVERHDKIVRHIQDTRSVEARQQAPATEAIIVNRGSKKKPSGFRRRRDASDRTVGGVDSDVIADEIAAGLRNNEFSLHYQPKVDPRTGLVVSAEALLRWENIRKYQIGIETIIHIAEQTDLIDQITKFVIHESIDHLAQLKTHSKDILVSINVSAANLNTPGFVEYLVKAAGQNTDRIILELTETMSLDGSEDVDSRLAYLSELGFRLSLDDYGAGFASLAQIRRLPLRELKLDRQFIQHLTLDRRGPLIVRSSIDLAHALELQIVAEGVEDAETYAMLSVMGCNYLQGYFIAKPMPFDSFIKFLDSREESERLNAAAKCQF